jgi:hypothetical protein
VTEMMYILQAALIGGVIGWLVRHELLIVRAQVLIWTIGVVLIVWRFGLVGQLDFYSNDQRWYTETVRYYAGFGLPDEIDPWLGKKVPFTFSALPLAMLGIHPTLALKAISLICLLALSRALLRDSRSKTGKENVATLWLTACGTIGTFFSQLALRETMMMYFVYQFATSRSVAVRGSALVTLFLLRPHLAAAVATAEAVMVAWRWVRIHVKLGNAESPTLIAIGVVLGSTLFTWGVGGTAGLRTPFSGGWGIPQAIRIASNFVGLQFLTVPDGTVNFSLIHLLLLRLLLSETIIIPIAFTVVCVFAAQYLTNRGRFTILAFTFYVSVASSTDFNSFRQNIPFMPLMGLVVLNAIRSRTINSESKTFAAARLS